jgi:hypothetical protein
VADTIYDGDDELPTIIDNGVEFQVIWSGGQELIGPRDSVKTSGWSPSRRLYNKKSDYWESRKEWTFQQCANNDHDKCVSPTEDGGVCKCGCHKTVV